MLNFNGVSIPRFVKVRAVSISALPSINTNLKGINAGYGAINGKTSLGEKYLKAEVSILQVGTLGILAYIVSVLQVPQCLLL